MRKNLGWSQRDTLSLWNNTKSSSATKAANLFTRWAEVMTTKKITFIVRWASEQVASGSKAGLVRVERTRLRSYMRISLLAVGKVLRRLQRNLAMDGWLKTEKPSTGGSNTLTVARCTGMEEWVRPEKQRLSR